MGIARHVPGCDCDCQGDDGGLRCGVCTVDASDPVSFYFENNVSGYAFSSVGSAVTQTGSAVTKGGQAMTPIGSTWWTTPAMAFAVDPPFLGVFDWYVARGIFAFVEASILPQPPGPGACLFVSGLAGGFTTDSAAAVSTSNGTQFPSDNYQETCQSSPVAVEFSGTNGGLGYGELTWTQ